MAYTAQGHLQASNTINDPYQDFRCSLCNRLLFKGELTMGVVQIKCKKCGQIRVFHQLEDSLSSTTPSMLIDRDGVIINASVQLTDERMGGSKELLGSSINALLSSLDLSNAYAQLAQSWKKAIYDMTDYFEYKCTDTVLRWRFVTYGGVQYMLLHAPTQAYLAENKASPCSIKR